MEGTYPENPYLWTMSHFDSHKNYPGNAVTYRCSPKPRNASYTWFENN